MPNTDRELAIYISGPALELLKKLDYPGSTDVLASATSMEEGIELTGSTYEFESLAGWVAGEANHADRRARRKIELLYDICDELESALAGGRRIGW